MGHYRPERRSQQPTVDEVIVENGEGDGNYRPPTTTRTQRLTLLTVSTQSYGGVFLPEHRGSTRRIDYLEVDH